MRTKQEIAAAVRGALPPQHEDAQYTPDQLVGRWFMSKRVGNGLELTAGGDSAFRSADIEHAERALEYNTASWEIYSAISRKLKQRIPCPYFLFQHGEQRSTVTHIRIYDTGFAMWIDLHGGIRGFLETSPLEIKY